MSQPCSLVELVLIDARDLATPSCRMLLAAARERGTHLGAVAPAGNVAAVVAASGVDALLEFWLAGDGDWPFARVATLTGVESARTLFASDDPAARAAANTAGLHAEADALAAYLRLMP